MTLRMYENPGAVQMNSTEHNTLSLTHTTLCLTDEVQHSYQQLQTQLTTTQKYQTGPRGQTEKYVTGQCLQFENEK